MNRPAEGWSVYIPGETPRRCSQPHCGSLAAIWKAKPTRAGRLRIWAWCERDAKLRGMTVECGLVVRLPAVVSDSGVSVK